MSLETDAPYRFKTNVLSFLTILSEIVQELGNNLCEDIDSDLKLISFASGWIRLQDDKELISSFIDNTNKYWEKISKKDESFFINNSDTIFNKDLFLAKSNIFKNVFSGAYRDKIADNDRDLIWKYFFTFVKISINHIYESRNQLSNIDNVGLEIGSYNKSQEYRSVGDLDKYVKMFGVTLKIQ